MSAPTSPAPSAATANESPTLPEAAWGWPLVLALAVGQVVSWGALYYAFSLFVVPMEAELGWSKTVLNGALSAGLLASAMVAFPMGSWIDRHGGRALMSAGSIAASLLLVAWSWVESPVAFYAIWIGIGITMGATLYEPVFAVITRSFHKTSRMKITGVTLIGGFAGTVFIPLTHILIESLGWRDALLALAACNLLICLPIHGLWLRDRDDGAFGGDEAGKAAAAEASRDSVRRALRHPVFWGLVVCFSFYNATFAALTFHLVPMLAERGLEMALIVGAYATIGPSQVAGRVVVLAIGNRASPRAIGRVVTLMFPISVGILAMFPTSVVALFTFTILYGSANGIMTIIRGTSVPELLWREGFGAISGAMTLPANIAKAVAPLATALFWQWGGYDLALGAILVGGLLASAGFWFAAAASKRLIATGAPSSGAR